VTFLVGGGVSRQTVKPAKQLRIQSSIEGKALPIGWGQNRLAGNLIWYGDFKHTGGGSSGKGAAGGKGGGGGGGKGGKGGGSQVKYSAAVVIAMAEGPVAAFDRVWNNQTLDSFAKLNLTKFLGSTNQNAWGYLATKHPEAALNYRGVAYMAAGPMKLGASPALPNLTVEITFAINTALPGQKDANPKDVVVDFLTNAHYGVGFPTANLGTLALYASYCLATGMLVSPILADAIEAAQFLKDLFEATNAEAVWSGGKLTVVPYGDTVISANGVTYTPPAATGYSLTDADLKPPQGGNPHSGAGGMGSDPVQCTRLNPKDQKNCIPVEYLDRANEYNPKVVDAKDDGAIASFGLRRADPRQRHLFCLESAALMSGHLELGRQAVRNTYAFTVGAEYILLDPMDIVAITDANLGMQAALVRIKEITENQDRTLTMLAEDFLPGTGWAPPYGSEDSAGFRPDYNVDPGHVNPPVIWEPTYELTQGVPEIWLAVSGASDAYGGCEIWISTDDATYSFAGVLDGPSRIGVLTAPLPAIATATTGPTIDQAHTLKVDLAQTPGAQLLSGSQGDALAANTLCYVDGEYLAYQTATLVGGQRYDLSYLNRGLFHTSPAQHASGSAFVRLEDGTVFPFAITPDRIGQTLYFKFLAYNANAGGKQELDEVAAYPYIVRGTPITAPVADVSNLAVVFIGSYANLTWDEVVDFRAVRYEIRQGATWSSGQIIGDVAHPPFRIPGNGTYWVGAYATPTPSLTITSANPPSATVSGALILSNVIAAFDEAATGWGGIYGGTAGRSGTTVVTTGAADVFALGDLFGLADLFNNGGQDSGSYEIPASHRINIGRVATCNVNIAWAGQGQVVGSNVLTVVDWLGQTDVLGFAATANTTIFPEVATSQDGAIWGDWQKFQAGGALTGMAFKARMQLQTRDAQTQAVLTAFSFAVDVPDRSDHYNRLAIAPAGTTVTFTPDGSATPAAFNGGPGSDNVPHVQGTIIDAQAGDQLIISNLTDGGCTVRVLNGGSGVARTVNILAQGY